MADWRDDLKSPEQKEREAALVKAAENEQAQRAIQDAYKVAYKALDDGSKALANKQASLLLSGNKVTLSAREKSVGIDITRDGMKITVTVDGEDEDEISFGHDSKSLQTKKGPLSNVDNFIGQHIKRLAEKIA